MPQRFEKNHPRDAVTISCDITDGLAAIEFSGDPIKGLVNAFFGEMRAAPVEELDQPRAKHFVGFACALFVRV
jgi:hypothetical protein